MPHVLIIDDQEPNIKVLGRLLEAMGSSHISLKSPDGVGILLEESPTIDFVFVDLQMPGWHYTDLLPYLRSDRRLSNVPVIAYSVHTNLIDELKHIGFDGFIGKPLEAPRFADVYDRILSGEEVWII